MVNCCTQQPCLFVFSPVIRPVFVVRKSSTSSNHTMTPWRGVPFRITGPLWGESTSDRSIPLAKGKWSYVFFFFVWAGCWTNNRFAGDSRRHALMWRHHNVKSCRVSESIPVYIYIYTYIFIYATFNFVVHLLLDIGISLRVATLLCDNNLIMD